MYKVEAKKTEYTVEIGGKTVMFKRSRGAGSELDIAKDARKQGALGKRIASLNRQAQYLQDNATNKDDFVTAEECYVRAEQLEVEQAALLNKIMAYYRSMFSGTGDTKKEVDEWLDTLSTDDLIGYHTELSKQVDPEAARKIEDATKQAEQSTTQES